MTRNIGSKLSQADIPSIQATVDSRYKLDNLACIHYSAQSKASGEGGAEVRIIAAAQAEA